jgi:hypothetical protein
VALAFESAIWWRQKNVTALLNKIEAINAIRTFARWSAAAKLISSRAIASIELVNTAQKRTGSAKSLFAIINQTTKPPRARLIIITNNILSS